MAFVVTPSTHGLRVSRFTTQGVDARPQRLSTASRVRMAADNSSDADDPKPVGSAGKSLWKEDLFVGGFPGGEGFFKKWVEDGMLGDVPDIPKAFQPSSEFNPKEVVKEGFLAALDKIEFFKGVEAIENFLTGDDGNQEPSSPSPSSSSKTKPSVQASKPQKKEDFVPPATKDSEVPDKSLYTEYFPDSYLNKAPMIDIHYSGSLSTASVRVSLETVEPLPTLPPPPKKGEPVTSLKKGSGGGLKLDISIFGDS